jgi:hypothetical protein
VVARVGIDRETPEILRCTRPETRGFTAYRASLSGGYKHFPTTLSSSFLLSSLSLSLSLLPKLLLDVSLFATYFQL